MKQLKKIRLRNAVVLENQEMKMIFGGSGISFKGGNFSCSCSKGANPPFNSTWFKFYHTNNDMIKDLEQRCRFGEGGCDAVRL